LVTSSYDRPGPTRTLNVVTKGPWQCEYEAHQAAPDELFVFVQARNIHTVILPHNTCARKYLRRFPVRVAGPRPPVCRFNVRRPWLIRGPLLIPRSLTLDCRCRWRIGPWRPPNSEQACARPLAALVDATTISSGRPPPSAARLFQKIECRTFPDTLNARVFSSPTREGDGLDHLFSGPV
jgi:hypothetical protein